MNLSISTKYPTDHRRPGSNTYFISKIWRGLKFYKILTEEDRLNKRRELIKNWPELAEDLWPGDVSGVNKIHTFRGPGKDPNECRFKEGTLIHFSTWTGKPYRSPVFKFAPVVKCTGTQIVDIKHKDQGNGVIKTSIYIDWILQGEIIRKDGKVINTSYTVEQIINNDGFKTPEEFLEWFTEDFNGFIIHWTDKRY